MDMTLKLLNLVSVLKRKTLKKEPLPFWKNAKPSLLENKKAQTDA